MKVLMLTTSYPRWEGDYAGSFIHSLSKKLIEKGCSVVVLAPLYQSSKSSEVLEGVSVKRFSYMPLSVWQKLAYGAGFHRNLRNPLNLLQLPFFTLNHLIRATIMATSCDIIHAHWLFSGLIAVLAGKITNKPVVLTLHGSGLKNMPDSIISKVLIKWILSMCSKTITVNSKMCERLISSGVNAEKITFIPNGVDCNRFKEPQKTDNTNRIISVGSLVEVKGHMYLLQAFKHVSKEYPTARLVLVGDGPLRHELEDIASKLGISVSVEFVGEVGHNRVPSLLESSDLFVLPSLSEGMPLALLEAMCASMAVIASNIDGIPDVVEDGVTGLIVEPEDASSLSESIKRLLGDNKLRCKMGLAARARVMSKFTLDRVSEDTLQVYQKVYGVHGET